MGLVLRGCPRCGGALFDTDDGRECLNCGYQVPSCPHCAGEGVVRTPDGLHCPHCGYRYAYQIPRAAPLQRRPKRDDDLPMAA